MYFQLKKCFNLCSIEILSVSFHSRQLTLQILLHFYFINIIHIQDGSNFSANSSLLCLTAFNVILMAFYTFTQACIFNIKKLMFFSITLKLFQGALQDVRLISGPHGYLNQCPHLDTSCPTCGQFSVLQSTVDTLTRHLQELSQRVCLFTTG